MDRPREHPVPTERRVAITHLDKARGDFNLERLLGERGFDLSLPYRQETVEEGSMYDLYVQDIPQTETS